MSTLAYLLETSIVHHPVLEYVDQREHRMLTVMSLFQLPSDLKQPLCGVNIDDLRVKR